MKEFFPPITLARVMWAMSLFLGFSYNILNQGCATASPWEVQLWPLGSCLATSPPLRHLGCNSTSLQAPSPSGFHCLTHSRRWDSAVYHTLESCKCAAQWLGVGGTLQVGRGGKWQGNMWPGGPRAPPGAAHGCVGPTGMACEVFVPWPLALKLITSLPLQCQGISSAVVSITFYLYIIGSKCTFFTCDFSYGRGWNWTVFRNSWLKGRLETEGTGLDA